MSAVTQTRPPQPLALSAPCLAWLCFSIRNFIKFPAGRLPMSCRCRRLRRGIFAFSAARRSPSPRRRMGEPHLIPISSFTSSRNSFSSSELGESSVRWPRLYLVGADSRPRVAAREPGAARAAGGAHDGARVPNCGQQRRRDQWYADAERNVVLCSHRGFLCLGGLLLGDLALLLGHLDQRDGVA